MCWSRIPKADIMLKKGNTVSSGRIIYRNWIAEQGFVLPENCPYNMSSDHIEAAQRNEASLRILKTAVSQALESLDEQERYLIIRFYFMGQTIGQISAETDRAGHKLYALHRRATKKLKKRLAAFVGRRYKIGVEQHLDCIICQSPHRPEIDALLRDRDKVRSLKPVIAAVKERYSIIITTPQILIGHEKYH